MADAFAQTRAVAHLRILVDSERDWLQATLDVRGAEEPHQLALVVHHPESYSELASLLPRLLLELQRELRMAVPVAGQEPPSTNRV